MTHAQKNLEQLKQALDEDDEAIPERLREKIRKRVEEADDDDA